MTHTHGEGLCRFTVVVNPAQASLDVHGQALLSAVLELGFSHIERFSSARVYMLEGDFGESEIKGLADGLLADPVTERYTIHPGFARREDTGTWIEVHVQPGVMNPAAQSAVTAIRRFLRRHGSPASRIDTVDVGRRYVLLGAKSAEELDEIARALLANPCIERWYIHGFDRRDGLPERFPAPPARPFELRRIHIRALDESALLALSRNGHLFLSLDEMRAIQAHYVQADREPTDLELETFAQTWSEHCIHKTLKSAIVYRGNGFGEEGSIEVEFQNLLKETIMHATHSLNKEWCLSVFADNAGVAALDEEYGVAFKVETHNHPSALEPYGGASTGVGGCIRDIMGCGLGAKPIASTDVFCLAPPDFDPARTPRDVIHPRRTLRGVVGGVRDYGNRMGIPTVNGAIFFDDRFLANPLVFCGCVGLIPRDRIRKGPRSGDKIVLAGGRTGRDGIHGATFSSAELTETHADEFAHAVQIGNAIEEKKLLDALLIARDHPSGCLFSAVTDCGAGGLSSAVGEMAAELGADVELGVVPLKYAGLRYDEIWISEAQERMVFAVPRECLNEFLRVFTGEDVEATVIGEFTNNARLRAKFNGTPVGDIDLRFLHTGLPKQRREATWFGPEVAAGSRTRIASSKIAAADAKESLLRALSDWSIASKEPVIRQYDHEVQGRSVIKPLVGPGYGPSDAAVIRPRPDTWSGIAIGCGLNMQRSFESEESAEPDPYWTAVDAVDEAFRNVICVGANPERVAILDNFCWPKVDTAESLGALVRACRGAADAAVAFGLPFISGKDSLNNQYSMSGDEARRTGLPTRLAIPYTLLVSAMGRIDDIRRCVSMDFKCAGNAIVLASAPVQKVGWGEALLLHQSVSSMIRAGAVRAAHDISDGGVAVALAEMCIASEFGAKVSLSTGKWSTPLFHAAPSTYLLEVEHVDSLAPGMSVIGEVTAERTLVVDGGAPGPIRVGVDELSRAWRTPFSQIAMW